LADPTQVSSLCFPLRLPKRPFCAPRSRPILNDKQLVYRLRLRWRLFVEPPELPLSSLPLVVPLPFPSLPLLPGAFNPCPSMRFRYVDPLPSLPLPFAGAWNAKCCSPRRRRSWIISLTSTYSSSSSVASRREA
jgi:hypothetical protein